MGEARGPLDGHRPAGYNAVHYLLHVAEDLSETFCRRTSGNITSDPRAVTCVECQWIILRAWVTRGLVDGRQALAAAVTDRLSGNR